MNRSLAGMAVIALLLSTFGMAFGQGYYGYGTPMQAAPGGYGQGYAMPGYDPGYQQAPMPGYQAPQAYPYGQSYPSAYPQGGQAYQPYALPQAAAPSQYPQAAPGNYYTVYPQGGGEVPVAPMPEGYDMPGPLVQDEIYWDPNYDRSQNATPVVIDPQAHVPQPPVATQARAVPSDQRVGRSQQTQAPRRGGQEVSNRKPQQQAKRTPSRTEKPKASLGWGKGTSASRPEPTEREPKSSMGWGRSTASAQSGETVASNTEQVRTRAPEAAAQPRPQRLPWGSN